MVKMLLSGNAGCRSTLRKTFLVRKYIENFFYMANACFYNQMEKYVLSLLMEYLTVNYLVVDCVSIT